MTCRWPLDEYLAAALSGTRYATTMAVVSTGLVMGITAVVLAAALIGLR